MKRYLNLEERYGDFCIEEQKIRREDANWLQELIDKVTKKRRKLCIIKEKNESNK